MKLHRRKSFSPLSPRYPSLQSSLYSRQNATSFVLNFKTKELRDACNGLDMQGKIKGDAFTITILDKLPAKNSKVQFNEPNTLITIYLPETISNRQVADAFSNFGKIVDIFYGKHKFCPQIGNGKRHLQFIPKDHEFTSIPRKIAFHDGVIRNVMYPEKIISCDKCKQRHSYVAGCNIATEDKIVLSNLQRPRMQRGGSVKRWPIIFF